MMGSLAAILILTLAACAGAVPQRIVSLSPSHTEILFALGLDREIVGVTRYCTLPPGAAPRALVGGYHDPELERIVSLKPDLVVTGLWKMDQTSIRLRRMGVRVIELDAQGSLAGVERAIETLGRETGRAAAAGRLVREMRAHLARVERRGRELRRHPRIYAEVFSKPLWSAGRGTYVDELIAVAGGTNIFADLSPPSATVSPEIVIARAPDVILSYKATRDEISRRPGWQAIPAVRDGRIIDDIPEELLSRMGPRLPQAAEMIQERLLRWYAP